MAQNIQCAMSGRNCREPIARLRNAGARGHSVAYLFRGLDDPLWLWPQHDVLARIISKCRCAKCQCQHGTCASDRPAAAATESCFHCSVDSGLAPNFCKLIRLSSGTEIRHCGPAALKCCANQVQSVQRKCSRRRLFRRAFASSLRLPPLATSLS